MTVSASAGNHRRGISSIIDASPSLYVPYLPTFRKEFCLIRFLGYFRMDSRRRPGTPSPDAWHFSLSASSMIGARLRHRERRYRPCRWAAAGFAILADRAGSRKRYVVFGVRTYPPQRWHRSTCEARSQQRASQDILMLLAQSGKCRGFGGRAPKRHGSRQRPDEPEF